VEEQTLRALAFGDHPPPPEPVTAPRSAAPWDRLLAAVVLGAQGRYAAASTALTDLRRSRDPLLASLAATTLASHRRQLGGHTAARALDGEALALVGATSALPLGPSSRGGCPVGSRFSGGGAGSPDSRAFGVAGRGAAADSAGNPGSRAFGAAGRGAAADPAGNPGSRAFGAASRGAAADSAGNPGSRAFGAASRGAADPVASLAGADSAAAGPAADLAAADPAAANPAPSASVSGEATPDPGISGAANHPAANHPTADSDYSDPDGLDCRGARADALLGLAADNLALGRIAAARRLAARAVAGDGRWRATVRAGWVGAEIELAAGRPAEAVAPARRAAETARERGARRHVVKSDIVLGVALSAAGDTGAREAALALVESALAEAEKCELHSLIWVAARVAADLGAQHAEKYRFRGQEVLHAVLRRVDPCVMRIAQDSPWVPTGAG
jgi:hypothetical protein